MSIDVERLAGEVAALQLICGELLVHLADTEPAASERLAERLSGFVSVPGEHIVGKFRIRSRKATVSFVECLEAAISKAR